MLHLPEYASTMAGRGQRGIGGQQQAHLGPAGTLRQLAPDYPDDDALEEAWAAHGMAQSGRAVGIAGDGMDRGRQRRDRIGIEARAIEPAAPSGLARRRQREQGGVAPDLADDLMVEAPTARSRPAAIETSRGVICFLFAQARSAASRHGE